MSLNFLEQLSKNEPTTAEGWLRLASIFNNEIPPQFEKTFACYLKATQIEDKNAHAWNNLGLCYSYGRGTTRDPQKAFTCFSKATQVNNTNATAWNNLAVCHQKGIGTSQDYHQAFDCFLKVTEIDGKNAGAWAAIGVFYKNGWGTSQDYHQAFTCYLKATQIDDRNAQAWNNLGSCYAKGHGVSQNCHKAFDCYLKATQRDSKNAGAWLNLGRCYAEGIGTLRDPYKAIAYITKASQLDNKLIKQCEEYLREIPKGRDLYHIATNPSRSPIVTKQTTPTFNFLASLIKDINANKGTINCGHCALRLNEYFTVGKNLALPPVPSSDAGLSAKPIFKKQVITSCITTDPRIVKNTFSQDYRIIYDLNNESSESFPLYIDLTPEKEQSVRFKKITLENIKDTLQSLSRGKDGSAYGFIALTFQTDIKIGHIINFYVDKANDVYFIDAQRQELEQAITQELNMTGYRPEIFFIPSMPPEGYKIKKEEIKSKPTTAKDWLELAITLRNETPPKFEKAFRYCVKATKVNNNNARAWADLGICYAKGLGTLQDYQQAFICYKKATEIDDKHALAWNNLGVYYEKGQATLKDEHKAFTCYLKATQADNRLISAWNNLGNCYATGRGTLQNDKEAFACFSKLLELDDKNAKAWLRLGIHYAIGQGVKVDPYKAIAYITKASQLDSKLINQCEKYLHELKARSSNLNQKDSAEVYSSPVGLFVAPAVSFVPVVSSGPAVSSGPPVPASYLNQYSQATSTSRNSDLIAMQQENDLLKKKMANKQQKNSSLKKQITNLQDLLEFKNKQIEELKNPASKNTYLSTTMRKI